MEVSTTAVTTGDRDSLFAWWTDYAEEDHATRAFARYGHVTRRVVWLEPGKGVEYEDEGKVIGLPVTFRTTAEFTPPERVKARTSCQYGVLDTDYWFEALPGGGTRVTARAHYTEPRVVRKVAPLTNTALQGALAYDLRTHLKEFERDVLGRDR